MSARPSKLLAAGLYGGTLAAGLVAPALARRARTKLPASSADSAVSGALIGAGWVTIALAERRRPFRRDWNEGRGDGTADLVHVVVSAGLAQVVAGAITPVRRRLARTRLARAYGRLPLPARIAVAVVAYDLFHTAHHRLSHESGLWRFHAVHHAPRRLYFGNATRFHPLELAVDVAGEQVILAVLGADPPTRLALQVVRGVYGQIQHGNVDLDSGPLNAVLSTPERHRWHHSDDPAEGNRNYGAVVAVWDRVLGTDYLPDRPFDATVGLAGDDTVPDGWLGQVASPFTT